MIDVTNDAYERLKELLDKQEAKVKLVTISLSRDDKHDIMSKIEHVLKDTAKIEPYIASLIANNLTIYFDDLVNLKVAQAKQDLAKKNDGQNLSPIFRRSEE